MTQASRPQADNRNNGYADAGPYSHDEWAERMRAAHTGDVNTTSSRAKIRGVVPTYDNLLVTTISGTNATVATGAGMVYGSYLFNDNTVTFGVGAAAANSHIDLLCMVENNTNGAVATDSSGNTWTFPTDLTDYNFLASVPAYSARLVIISGADAAIPAEPTLDQLTTLYCVPIAEWEVDSAVPHVISNFVDRREFVDVETIVGVATADDDTIEEALIIGTQVTNGAGDDGLGVAIRAKLENSTGDLENAGQMAIRWTDATNGSEDARWELRLAAGNADNLSAVINAPTAASADGNARGAGAVDLQQTRTAATQVASGVYAHNEGNGNTASGDYAVAVGRSNVATVDYTKSSGYGAKAKVHGQVARSTYPTEPYRAQYSDYHIARTINHVLNVWAEVYLGAGADGLLLVAQQAMTFEVLLVGLEGIAGSTSVSFTFAGGVIRPNAGALVLTSGAITLLHNNTVSTFEARADVAGANALRIEVRCTDGTPSMYWSGVIRAAEAFGSAVP